MSTSCPFLLDTCGIFNIKLEAVFWTVVYGRTIVKGSERICFQSLLKRGPSEEGWSFQPGTGQFAKMGHHFMNPASVFVSK